MTTRRETLTQAGRFIEIDGLGFLSPLVAARETRFDSAPWANMNWPAEDLIDAARDGVDQALNGYPAPSFTIPVMYLGEPVAAGGVSNVFAYAPGDANMQVWGNQLWLARPFGPRGDVNGAREDLFLDKVRTVLHSPGVRVTVFVDNWDTYHRNFGEVHCGTNVIRLSPGAAFDRWWESEP